MRASLQPEGIAIEPGSFPIPKVGSAEDSTSYIHLGLGWIGDRGGGLERYQDGICRHHFAGGVAVQALVQSRVPIEQPSSYGVTAFASPEQTRREKRRKLRHCAAALLRRQATTLVSHHASVSDALLPLARGIPHVVHFHGPWAQEARVEGAPRWKTWLQRRQEARVYRSADRILTLSHTFKELVVRDYDVDERRVRVIPGAIEALAADPGISRREARTRLGWPTDRPILLSIRRLVRRVGVDVLVRVVAKMVHRHPDLLVLIGGSGPLRPELDELIHRHGLEDNVRLLGFVAAGDLAIAYRAADFSVVPTQSLEGFGLVTLESMAAGTPALVTPVGSLPEVMRPLSESLILPGKSVDRIAEGLDAILQGRVTVPDDQACRAFVRKHHDWSVIAPQVLDVYREATHK